MRRRAPTKPETLADRVMKKPEAAPAREGLQVRSPKIAEVVAGLLRKMILTGELKEGDFLQPEGQLMQIFSVSRPTLREAFRILEDQQFISVVRGSRSGARVRKPSVDSVARLAGFALQAEQTRLSDLYQARLAVEPFAVRLLAGKAVDRHIAVRRLRENIADCYTLIDAQRYEEFRVAVARVHVMLLEFSGNKTLTLLIKILEGVLEKHQSRFPLTKLAPEPEGQRREMRRGLKSIEKLCDLVEAGDEAGAEEHWRRHLEAANKSWLTDQSQTTMLDILDAP